MSGIIFLLFLLLNSVKTEDFSCVQRDYCNDTLIDHRTMNNSRMIKERNCFCDYACFQYDDCCEDIKHYQLKKQSIQSTCTDYMYPLRIRHELYIQTVMPIWMITSCLSNYEYTQLEKNCTNYLSKDMFLIYPLAYIPITSKRTNFTYANIYCAQCNNENLDSLINWTFENRCDGLKQNYTFEYKYGLDITTLIPEEAGPCPYRLKFPSSPAMIYPCKQQTINSCPNTFSDNQTISDLCSTVNAYRYVEKHHPDFTRDISLYRNEYCLMCHNISNSPSLVEVSCKHLLEDELIIDPKPKTGHRGVYRLSVLFDPNTFSIQMPKPSPSDYQYHSSYQTHFTPFYPCRFFEVYDYVLHTCIILQNEYDWRLTSSFNCTNPLLIRHDDQLNDSILFLSYELYRSRGDFVILFSDLRKLILCGERFAIFYIHHNRFITTVRYFSTIISLLSLLVFMISFNQKSTLHNLPGKCLLMFAISLHISQSMFLASGHFLDHSNRLWCIGSGMGVHLFYLLTFAWLTAISFDTCLTLTRMHRLDARVARNRFILYNILVWLFAITIVFISVCLHVTLSEYNPWSPNYGRILCSISSRYALITFFLVPNGFLIVLNCVLYIRTVIVIRRIDRETRLARYSTTEDDRSRTLLYFRLAFLMGVHWILLIVCIIFKQDILWLLFDITNSLPGLFIAIGFLRKQPSVSDLKAKFRSSQSQLSSLGVVTNAVSSTNINRYINSSVDASPNAQMSRKIDDMTEKLDKLAEHLLKPTNFLSTPAFRRSTSSL